MCVLANFSTIAKVEVNSSLQVKSRSLFDGAAARGADLHKPDLTSSTIIFTSAI